MLQHQYKEHVKKSHTLLDISLSHLGNTPYKIFPHAFQSWQHRSLLLNANLTTKRTVILPWGLNPYDLPCLQKSLVHRACENCLPGSEEPSCHLSSSLATTSEDIGRQPTRPRRRSCYNGAKRAQEWNHTVVHLYKFSIQGRNITIFRLISKRTPPKVHHSHSFFPRDRRSTSNKFCFHKNLLPLPRVILMAQKSVIFSHFIQLSHASPYFIQVIPIFLLIFFNSVY